MSFGVNRDYKSTERIMRKRLSEHKAMMDRLLADFSEMTREHASALALEIIRGRKPYPIYQQRLG